MLLNILQSHNTELFGQSNPDILLNNFSNKGYMFISIHWEKEIGD